MAEARNEDGTLPESHGEEQKREKAYILPLTIYQPLTEIMKASKILSATGIGLMED